MYKEIKNFFKKPRLDSLSGVVKESISTIFKAPFFIVGNVLMWSLQLITPNVTATFTDKIIGIGNNIVDLSFAVVALAATPLAFPIALVASTINTDDGRKETDKSVIKSAVTKSKKIHVGFAQNAQVLDFFKDDAPKEINNNPKFTMQPIKASPIVFDHQKATTL